MTRDKDVSPRLDFKATAGQVARTTAPVPVVTGVRAVVWMQQQQQQHQQHQQQQQQEMPEQEPVAVTDNRLVLDFLLRAAVSSFKVS
jgi:hypothetical protein